MLESYKEKQALFYNFITNVSLNNKISHAYMIETNGVSYGFDLALALVKYFLCPFSKTSCDEFCDCLICSQIDNNSYLDLFVIENDLDEIRKDQILDLQEIFSTKAISGKYRIYIIKNANLLNKFSASTLLKFLEEPHDNIIAILLTNNVNNVISTIVSRCQIISLVKENNIFGLFLPYIGENDMETFYDQYIQKIVNFYIKIEEINTKTIIYKNEYIDIDKYPLYLKVGVYLYYDILRLLMNKESYFIKNFEMEKNNIVKNNTIDDIINKIDILNQFILNDNYNVNKDLFIDNFIITFCGGVVSD